MSSFRIFLLFACIGFISAHSSISDYLDERLRQTKVEIAKLHLREEPSVQRKLYNVKWDLLWRKDLDEERPFITNTFDKILLVQGNRFVEFASNASSSASNRTSSRETIASLKTGPVKFVRSIVWKGVLYLLICYETSSCSVYTGTDNLQLKHRQIIQHKGRPMDASFFVRANRLYLVVIDNSCEVFVPSLIYHWRGTYMDVSAEAMTVAAVSVTTFKYKQSTIIVFAQNSASSPEIGSMVYEFKETGLDRVQFLSTSNPISVHHYSHMGHDFVLLVNERGPSTLFWWDGHELLSWQQVPEIESPNLVHVVSFNDDAFFFAGYASTLQLYKFENASDCALISSMALPKEMTLIDVRTLFHKSTMIIAMVTVTSNQIYGLESWELPVKEIPSESSIEESDILSRHLAELVELLQQRKPLVEKAEASWPFLLPANENLTITEPLIVPNLELLSGTVGNINVSVDEDVMTPRELQHQFENLIREVDDVLATSKDLLTPNNTNRLNGDIIVEGDAFIEELQIDKIDVDFFNDVDMRTQDSSNALKGKNLVVDDLIVDSLCGIPFEYWSLENDTSKMEINVGPDEIEFLNDTVKINSNLTLTNLNVTTINGTNIAELLNDLFIINRNQIIKGNLTYDNLLEIHNLTVQTLNGKPWDSYMNTVTNQTFDKFAVRKLRVENLHADTINGVPVSQAARISTPNVIKGETTIARLRVTDKFVMDSTTKLQEAPPHQMYFNVTIRGNLRIGTLDLSKNAKIFLNNEEINLNNISDTFWTKSTDQVIKDDVIFENSLTIDQLNVRYLNGFSEDEYLYTTATNIPESFKNLHFKNIQVDDMLFVDGENDSWLDIAPERVTIRERLHLKHLRADQLFTNVFNGLLTADILSGKQPHNFPRTMSFSTIKAEQLNVGELHFLFFNNKDRDSFIENRWNISERRESKLMKTAEFHVENLNVARINDLDMEKLLSLKDIKMEDLKNLVINGDLIVKGDLKVNQIDDQPAMTYLENMAKEDIVIDNKMTIDELIVQNATLKFLHGHEVNNLFDGLLSKSRDQFVPGRFSFYKVTTNNIETKFINDQDTSELMWIDKPLNITGNVTFEDLFVEGDVVTKTLNGRDVNELYESLLNISIPEIAELRVDGNVTWNVPSSNRTSLSFLFENAVTKTTNQTIRGDIIFHNGVSVSKLFAQWEGMEDIRKIVDDAAIDDGDIEITGEKIFKENLRIDTLSVTDNIDIPVVNNVNIVEFNNSVAKRDRNETINGTITFLEQVVVEQILVNDSLHDIPLKGVVLATDRLPSPVVFKDLTVLQDVAVKNFDGVDFDEFLKDRITLDGDHEISADVQFNGIVEVLGNANVSRINDIDPFDLVLNGTDETQVISGSKIFQEDVIVDGNIYTTFINGMNISSEYSSGIQNDEDVEIIGDLIFQSTLKVPTNVSVSNLVNGVKLHAILNDLQEEKNRTLEMFARNETKMEKSIEESSSIAATLRNVFAYLEAEEKLKIQAPNIKKVDVVYYEHITKLNMFGEEPGPLCGLPSNCSCPTEYVAELTKEDCRIRRINATEIVRNYHETQSTFGVNVITNAVSYSPECTSNNTDKELITISWMKPEMIDTGDTLANVREASSGIRGFLRDAKLFTTRDNAAFVVLAMYYDASLATHRTDSVIYKIDFEKNALSLHQKLLTDGAWAIEIFKMNHRDVYLLLGCFGDSQKSFLYKLDPITSKFVTKRSFGGKTRHVKSLFQEENCFVLLDDFDTNAINIFRYDSEVDNFSSYQSLFHDSRVDGLECFYADEFGQSDAFVIVTTENDQFYVYEYMYAQKFQLRMQHRIDDLQAMVPFYYLGNHYIFTGTSANSTILRIVKHGPH